jgi:DNA-binding transcriptional regulator GbsR (MarR family)
VSYAHSAAVQDLSKTVFGQKHRLPAMLAIADSAGIFTATELTQALGLTSQSMIQLPLKALEDAGLICRLDSPSDRSTYYQRNEASSAWKFARELVAAALRSEVDLPSLP